MRKLLKHLKPYTATIVVIIGFLIVQATCDLSLPSYTSDIVNVGIQQGGIDEKIPEAVTEEEMERLEETFEFMEFYTMRNDIEKMLVINTGFHQIIYEASHNRMLQKQLASYQNFLKYKNSQVVRSDSYLTTVLEEHRAIFKAFVDKAPREGALAMEIHMSRSKERRCG